MSKSPDVTPENIAIVRGMVDQFKIHPDFIKGDRAFVGSYINDFCRYDNGGSLAVLVLH